MSRVKRGTSHVKKRRRLMRAVKGYSWGRKSRTRRAKPAATKAGAQAFADRRDKKGTFRALWNVKINAFVREHGLSYSTFINALKKNNIALNRKIIADLAVNNKKVLANFIAKIK